jgi:hypothetical protein
MPQAPTENGWYLLVLTDGRKIAGYVRLESTADGVQRLEVQVPTSQHYPPDLAIIAPDTVQRSARYEPDEVKLIAAALRKDAPDPKVRLRGGGGGGGRDGDGRASA